MNETLFVGFLIATLLILSTPGPSCALAASQALRFGPMVAAITVAGDALGSLAHIIVATIGLNVIVNYSQYVLPWLQIIGALYIIYLAVKNYSEESIGQPGQSRITPGYYRAFFSGFIACITNPKAIVFFMAFFPGFIDQDLNIFLQSFVYGIIFIVLDVISILFYALLAYKVVRMNEFASRRYNIISATGLFLVGTFMLYRGIMELVF